MYLFLGRRVVLKFSFGVEIGSRGWRTSVNYTTRACMEILLIESMKIAKLRDFRQSKKFHHVSILRFHRSRENLLLRFVSIYKKKTHLDIDTYLYHKRSFQRNFIFASSETCSRLSISEIFHFLRKQSEFHANGGKSFSVSSEISPIENDSNIWIRFTSISGP